ncbi:chaplin [Streptomyces sp. NPDC053560]|uniref:chaplin n=1 Tax=Streptomyces sp. NPDC053560 TaxID=3365711 RepID=UPI0037D41453
MSIRTALAATALAAATVLGGATASFADANAGGKAHGSPGVLSGNVVQVPVDVSANVCGNSINVIGLLNPAAGNGCAADSDHHGKHHGRY